MAFQRRSYVGVLVTLTANTVQNLFALVDAVITAETQGDNTMHAPGTARELTITSFNGVDGVGGNNKDILVGDALVASPGRAGYILAPGQSRTYRAEGSWVSLMDLHTLTAGTSQKLLVEITSF